MKRKFLYIIGCISLLAIVLPSCKKFLDIPSNNNTALNPTSVSDFEEILNATSIRQNNYFLVDLTADDISIYELADKTTFLWRVYSWAPELFGVSDNDEVYNSTYKTIMHMNFVVNGIDNATEGTPERKAIAKAQAKINRAYHYFQLVNIYAPTYNASTASTDLGVPLVLNVSSTGEYGRATVQQVYDQILSDLNDAVNTPELPNFSLDVIHPAKVAALAMQAKAYLQMGNYTEALAAANAALAIKNTVLDYATMEGRKPLTLLEQQTNPEVILAQSGSAKITSYGSTNNVIFDYNLQKLWGRQDLRLTLITEEERFFPAGVWLYHPTAASELYQFDYSITVPEMMLIKAECLARAQDGPGAMALVNQLRKHRFEAKDYKELDANLDGPAALQQVLDERRRELFMHGGVRLFDVKRLGLPMQRGRISRYGQPATNITPQPANSKRFIFPFAKTTLDLSPKIIQNER